MMKIARTELNKPLNVYNVTKLKGRTRPYGSEFIYLHINCMGTIEKRHMRAMCECICECFCSLTECVPSQSIFCVRFILTSFLCRCTLLIFTLATRTNPINMFVTPLTVTQLPKLPQWNEQSIEPSMLARAVEMSGKQALVVTVVVL